MLFLKHQILYDAEIQAKTKMYVLHMFNTNVIEGLKTYNPFEIQFQRERTIQKSKYM